MQREESTLPSLHFATNSFVGNLGAPFRVSNDDDDDEELQGTSIDDHELRERNIEAQGVLVIEDA